MTEWQTYTDRWHGVRLERPANWAVHPEPGGARVLADDEGWNWAYGRWLAGENLPTPQAVANGALARLRSRLPDLRALRSPQGDGARVLLRLEANSPRGPLLGVLKVTGEANLLFVLGFMARRDDLPTLKAAFERVLRSFRPVQPIPRRLWREPTEGAFTVQLPVDWSAQGGVQRDPASGFGQLVFQAIADPQGLTGVLLSTVPQMFVAGGGMFGMGLPGMPTCPYCDVPTYVQQVLVPQMRSQYPDLRVEWVRPLPQVRERLAREAAMLAPGYPLRLDAAQVSLLYGEAAVPLRQQQEVHTFEVPAAMMMPSYWVAETPWSYRAPARQWAGWEPVLSGVAASFHIEPAWEAREAALRQQQIMAANRRTQSLQMMTCWNISRDMDLIDDMLWSSYERRSAAEERIAHAWSDAILGQRDITTPWGETIHGVEAGFNRYWVNALGDVLASDDWLFEPGVGWTEVSGGR